MADLEIAQRIGVASRDASRAERQPTLEHLLAAFGEREPTTAARRRVASALTLAGIRPRPAVPGARPGARIALRLRAGTRAGGRLIAAVALLALLLAAVAIAWAVSQGDDGRAAPTAPAVAAPRAGAPPTATLLPAGGTVGAGTLADPPFGPGAQNSTAVSGGGSRPR